MGIYHNGPIYRTSADHVTPGDGQPGTANNPPGRPRTYRLKLHTALRPCMRSDLHRLAKEMNMPINAFIEYLIEYFVTTENAIAYGQEFYWRAMGDGAPLPPYLKFGVKHHDYDRLMMVHRSGKLKAKLLSPPDENEF